MSRRILIPVFITSSLTLLVGKSQACNLPPIPDINNPYYQDICVGCKPYFDGSTSYDQDEDGNSVETYYWKYFGGDSWHNDGAEPNHTYNTAGVYYVSLRVRDDENTNSLPENDDSCWVYVYQVTKVETGGKQTGQNLYRANDYLDEPAKRQVLYQLVQATLYPNVVTPDTFYWTPGPSAPTLPRIDPNECTSSWFYAKDHGVYNIAAHCCVSVKDMNIVIEGVDIKTANITDPCETSETYNIFLNENFDQQVEAPTEPGHTQCYYVDYNDNSLAGDANDELGPISFNAQTYGDAGARVTFQGYGIKLYDSDKNFLEFDNNGDGEPNYSPNAIGNTLYIEGITPGISTLTVILKTQDGFTASDQLLIKVIPLNLTADDPAPSSDQHEICHKDKLIIAVNTNDSDGDGTIDLLDSNVPGGDPDLAMITLQSPYYAEESDISGGIINVTFPGNINAYKSRDKTEGPAPTTYSLSELPVDIYLEGDVNSTGILDSMVTADMTLDSGVKCRDEIRYTVVHLELKSITFTSDHGVLNNNDSNWTDSGTTYSEPEWIPDGPDPDTDPEQNNPISHTKNVKLMIDTTVKVAPSGLTFDLIGDGSNNYVDFTKIGLTSTGSDQVITITADANLPNQVDILTKSIDWMIKLTDFDSYERDVGISGPHKVYVTYGTPAGSVVTERRVREVCTSADAKSSPNDCANAVYYALKPKSYSPAPAPRNGPVPIWLLHNAGQTSQCPGLAIYIQKHFEMLGLGTGGIRYCWAKADGTCTYDTWGVVHNQRRNFPVAGHSSPTTHDDVFLYERLRMIDAGSIWNNYEATCYFNGTYYALLGDYDGRFSSPYNVVTSCFSTAWYYWNASSWVGCPEVPW